MTLSKRRFKYIYYDDARFQLNATTEVYTMDEAPPGTDYWGEPDSRGAVDSEEGRGSKCLTGRDHDDSDDLWRTGDKRDPSFGHPDHHPGREDKPYTSDSNRWTEEEWLFYEQTQNY